MYIGFWWESREERDHLEDQAAGGWIILKWILGWGGMDWIDLAPDREQWRALVNMVMNVQVSEIAGKFLNICKTGGFSRGAQMHEVSYIQLCLLNLMPCVVIQNTS
jgi:hypothetical protein